MDSTRPARRSLRHTSARSEAAAGLSMTKGGDQVQRVLDLTGIAELVTIVDSPADVLEADRASDCP